MMSFGLTLRATHLVKSSTSPKVGHLVTPRLLSYPECLNTPPASKFFVMLNRLLPGGVVEKLFKCLNTLAITIEMMLVRSNLATQHIPLVGIVR